MMTMEEKIEESERVQAAIAAGTISKEEGFSKISKMWGNSITEAPPPISSEEDPPSPVWEDDDSSSSEDEYSSEY